MAKPKLVALPCQLFPGMFPSERVFQLILADGSIYRGIAPRHFCWDTRGQLVGEGETTEGVAGKVAGKLVEYLAADQVAVEVPDGEILAVPSNVVKERPTEIRPPTPEDALTQGRTRNVLV